EGEETVKEIQFGVKHAEMSKKHNTGNYEQVVYMNITSKEGNCYCVELSASGYRIVGRQYDNISGEDSTKYYETIYAFLDDVSPLYRVCFSDALAEKLKKLE
ncbi:hypothetical protein HELRODRAFT_152723, partial [Helobdella robusta]|uniref:GSKIP domain-containing protein n=1 Tax=Helobdella robusta TaxID=6412 RepID=T1EKW3_HELRO